MTELESQPVGACGYPKRFLHHLHTSYEAATAAGKSFQLILVSIDNFTMLLSGYGLNVSEQVMAELQKALMRDLPEGSSIYRVQRDQFAIALTGAAIELAESIGRAIEAQVKHHSHGKAFGALHMRATACVIAAEANDHGDQMVARGVLALADDGYSPSPLDAAGKEFSREEMGLANYLSQAIAENRLRYAFQPVVASATGEISHYEALLRLHASDGKITSAGALIPVAERMGMIETIDMLTLEMCVSELRRDPNVHLAFNISNLTTHLPEWMNHLTQRIEETPHIGERMIIELTETSIHRDLKHAAYFCAQAQALGCQVALDDFGSGYTSFRQLKALSVDMVKIDGSFVRDLMENADNRFFVKTLLDFTRGFGLKSVAEFVENGETAKLLMEMGADYLQGFYFGKPYNHRKWLAEGEYGPA